MARARRNKDIIESLERANRVIRDVVITLLATFLFVFGTITIRDPIILGIVFGAGASLLGTPAALRFREKDKEEKDEG